MRCPHPSPPASPPGPAWAHTGFMARRCAQLGALSASAPPASTALLPAAATAMPNGHPSGPALSQGLRTGEPQPEPPAQPPEGLRPREGLPWAQGRAGGARGPRAASGVQCAQPTSSRRLGGPLQERVSLRAPPFSRRTSPPSLEVTATPACSQGLEQVNKGRGGGPWDALPSCAEPGPSPQGKASRFERGGGC